MTWLTNWNRRKSIVISGSTAGAQSDYQMKLTVNQGNGTDSAGVVYLGGNVQTTFNDLRFTKSDGTTTLNYWIESIIGTTPNQVATVWIKLAPSPDTIPASPGTYNFYIYYNNTGASTASDGTNTFDFFDDFSGDLSKWDTTNSRGSWSIVSGEVKCNSGSDAALFPLVGSSWNSYEARVKTRLPASGNSFGLAAFFLKNATTFTWNDYRFTMATTVWNWYNLYKPPASNIAYQNYYMDASHNVTSWVKMRIYDTGGSTVIKYWLSNDNITWYTDTDTAGTYTDTGASRRTNGTIALISYDGVVAYFDDVIVRKYASPEPTFGTIGIEEALGSLNISSTPSGAVGASVYIDGNGIASGITPLTITGIIIGTHTYRLTKTGYTEIPATNFTIFADQTTVISQTMLTVANITATLMTITPSENPCRVGICTVTVDVTWTNNGESTGSFVPSITASSGIVTPVYPSEQLTAGTFVTHSFTVSGMTVGTGSICPNPN